MSLKVYLFHLSQPSRSVYNFLIENNIQYEEIIVDLAKGEHRGEQFLKINPQGTVPAINDNGLSLSESSAIMIHLAQTRKLPDHWYPSDPQAKAAVNQYLHWHHQNLRKGGMSFFYSYFMKDEQKKNQALNDFHEASKRIEERLKNSTNGYICNTTGPSIADFLAFHEYVSQVEYGIVDLSDKDYPHIKKWYYRLKHRESCRKTVEIAVELFRKLFPQSNENQDLSSNGLFKSDSQLSSVNKNWGNPSGEKEIEITKKSLEEKKHKVNVVSSEQEALELIKKVIPSGSSVYSAGSTTLSEIGFVDYLKGETPYNNIKSSILSEKDPKKQQELYRQGMFADYFVSSITAVSQDGEFAVCDLTGTRIGGFQTAKNVIVVIGSNKIVQSSEDVWKRTKEYCLPLESARVRVVYKFPASNISNMLVVKGGNPMAPPGRFHFIIVKKALGF